jgi:hypothetical protein
MATHIPVVWHFHEVFSLLEGNETKYGVSSFSFSRKQPHLIFPCPSIHVVVRSGVWCVEKDGLLDKLLHEINQK